VKLEQNNYKAIIFRRQTVWSLKKSLKKMIPGMRRHDMKLYKDGTLLEDTERLTSYTIKNGDCLLLVRDSGLRASL
jgi:uncharacterized ubiquitin-like protein YukD